MCHFYWASMLHGMATTTPEISGCKEPMIYRIKEKFWSWGNDFSITDQQGAPRFFVDGAVFSWGDKLSLQDLQGNEVAVISQTLLSFKPRYEILIGGKKFAEVVKVFLLKDSFVYGDSVGTHH